MDKVSQLSQTSLSQFTCSENSYRHALNRKVLFTDGANHVADAAGAYWLLDEIALSQYIPTVRAERFQVWKLAVECEASRAELTCEDGNDNIVYRKSISFTDFPLPDITLWFTDNTILLPSEY